MIRLLMCLSLLVALVGSLATADDKDKDKADKKGRTAKITNVDAQKGTVTVSMKDKDGNKIDKTFKLAEDIEYVDSTGKVASVDIFTSGDMVLFVEQDGQIKKMTNKDKPAKKEK